jgi:hypothetical protein
MVVRDAAGVAAAQVPSDGVGEGFEAHGTAGRQGGEQGMAGLQLPVEGFALEHPAEVVAGMANGPLQQLLSWAA